MKNEKNLGFFEREENYYWNVACACGTGFPGVLSAAYVSRTDKFSVHDRSIDRRDRSIAPGSENGNRAKPAYQNKTEKELNSLVKTKFRFSISLSKIINFFKK